MTIRVLLADDHTIMREGLRVLLSRSADISVVGEAATGSEAVRQAQDLRPDVIVMDIAMPELNGIEAARMIHARLPAIRVVILSMHSTSEHVYRALEAGATGYLLKEVAGNEVIAAIRTVHEGRQYLSTGLEMSGRGAAFAASPLERLSARERQVLQLVVEGHSSSEIASLVHLSPKSIDTYRSRLMKKLGVGNVPALVKFALEHGLTPRR
ncbi:MAG: response regulator [Burkholderiales bacterium]